MKKILALIIAVIMLTVSFMGCGILDAKEKIVGKWVFDTVEDEEETVYLLEYVDFYENEIALIKDQIEAPKFSSYIEFEESGNYTWGYNIEETKAFVREFYDSAFSALYKERNELNDTYDYDFTYASKEEFQDVWAQIYECADYDAMLDMMADSAYDYESVKEDVETGTYEVKLNQIIFTITGESEGENIYFGLKGDDEAVFEFADMVVNASREK